MKRLIILVGASGAGNSSAKFVFEEMNFYVTEHIPSDLTLSLLDSYEKIKHDRFCLIVYPKDADRIYKIAKNDSRFDTSLFLLDCSKSELIKRYALSRHIHPRSLVEKTTLDEAIENDIRDLRALIPDGDVYIDTTPLTVKELRQLLYNKLEGREEHNATAVTFISYGLKNGAPLGLDMSFDVRSIPNPYWVEELKELTGCDKPVIDYMMSFPETKELLDHIVDYLTYHLAQMQKAGRGNYVVGVSCSGGQHRSTFVAEYLAKHFSKKYKTSVIHHDSTHLNSIISR